MLKIIIIGGDHHNTLGIIRSIGETGRKVSVLIHGVKHSYISSSKYIESICCVKNNEIISCLLNKYRELDRKPILICTSDIAVSEIDKNYNTLKDYFSCPNVSQRQGELNKYLYKNKVIEEISHYGVICPQSKLIQEKSIIGFPCLLKPNNSINGTKFDIHVCTNQIELDRRLEDKIDYLIQPYLIKNYEICINGLAVKGGTKVIWGGVIKKIRESLGGTTYAFLESGGDYLDIPLQGIELFIEHLKYEGMFSVEFIKEKNGKLYFLEMNFRSDATMYAVTKSGINLPSILCNYYDNIPINFEQKQYFPITFAAEMIDFEVVIKNKYNLWHWFLEMKNVDCLFFYNKYDKRPFFAYIYQRCLMFIHNKVNKLF